MATNLPNLQQFQGGDQSFQLMQSAWSGVLNSFLKQPYLNGIVLPSIELAVGNNVINHKLGRSPQGWVQADIDGTSTIYRSAPFNSLTLTLYSSAAVTVSLYVF